MKFPAAESLGTITVIVELCDPPEVRVRLGGFNETLGRTGAPVEPEGIGNAPMLTWPAKLFRLTTSTETVPEVPLDTVSDVGFTVRVKSGVEADGPICARL